MSTILWLEKEVRPTSRPVKPIYAVVRFFAPGWYGSTKDAPVPLNSTWRFADTLAVIKADGPAKAWVTYEDLAGQERLGRYTHSLFVALPVEDLYRVSEALVEKLQYSYNVNTRAGIFDGDGHQIRVVTIF